MLDPHEKTVFDDLVARLGASDPKFVRKMARLGRPRGRLPLITAVLLWTVAPICVIVGGWSGLLMAVVAVGFGAHLFAQRTRGGEPRAWWSSAHRRPEASL